MKQFFENLVLETMNARVNDLHLKVGQPPIQRVAGTIKRVGVRPMTIKQMDGIAASILSPQELERLQRLGSVDLVYAIPDKCRMRVNVFFQRGTLALSARIIPPDIPEFRSLGLPPEVQQMLLLIPSGLILITGATNSGKSTTLTALIREICLTRSVNVITIEDPIEFLYPKFPSSLVQQREVGIDTRSFPDGMRAALRQSPDILVIGEFRTPEAVMTGLQAAETGHLVISTLHTRSASQTISRLVNIFPPHQVDGVRQMLAGSLRLVVTQALLPSLGGKGLTLAFEVLPIQASVPNLIRTNRLHEIPNVMETGGKFGCISMKSCIDRLVRSNKVSLYDVPAEYLPAKS